MDTGSVLRWGITLALGLVNLWIIGNDATGVGIADDPFLFLTIPAFLGSLGYSATDRK